MKTIFNRFAVIPCMCSDCKKYIWFEPYRKASCWVDYADRFINKKLCKDCVIKYK